MLPASMREKIRHQLDQGDEALDADEFTKAISHYSEALALIPDPKFLHASSLLAFTALGEAFFYAGYPEKALVPFGMALKAPGGVENPLLHLRLGQAYFENGEFDRAADSLTRAYAMDGRDVFDGEDDKYLAFLDTRIDL